MNLPTAQPAALLSAALGGNADGPADATAERILDAALRLAAASGIRNLTIEQVARAAGVGRMTVYRRFGDKAGLLEALAAREGRRCLDELARASPPQAPLAEQIVEGFVAAIRIAREHPLLRRLARHEPGSVLEALLAADAGVFRMGVEFARTRIEQAAGGVRGAAAGELAEVLVRLALSFILVRETALPIADDDQARAFARRLLAPLAHT